MASVEERLKYIEDRFALQDVVTAYCRAVDNLSDADEIANLFTEDALFDLSGLSLEPIQSRDAIRTFFAGVIETMQHHAHYNTNFTIEQLEGDTASTRNYVIGMGIAKDGSSVLVHARYDLDFARTSDGWKISRFREPVLMPLGDAVADMHG